MTTTTAPTEAAATFDAETGAPLTLHITAPVTLAEPDAETGEQRREFTALATTYEVDVYRPNFWLGTVLFRIAKGACTFRPDAKVFYGHDWQSDGTPIGRIVSATDADAGPTILGRLWKTPKADEIYELMQADDDGVAVLDRVSIGFYITEYKVEDADGDQPVFIVLAADVFETSVVPYPQFDGAAVDDVLHQQKGNPMSNPTATPPAPATFSAEDGQKLSAAVDTLSKNVDDLGAKLATFSAADIPDTPAEVFGRSYGEYVKELLKGNEEAQKFAKEFETLAYEGGVSSDTIWSDTWVGDIVQLIEKGRKVWNLFDSAPLPAEGTTLEYGKLIENTVLVDEQANEGDAIVMGNVKIGTDHADVYTFAGGSALTFQQALRSNVNVLDLHWRALALAYAKASETKARSILNAVVPQTIGSLASMEASFDGWIDFLVDAAMHFDDKALAPEYLRLSADVFKDLAKIREGADGPFLLNRDTGRINLLDQTGDVAGLRIVLDGSAGAGTVELGNSFALKTFESGGAPVRLGPEDDILTLTKVIGVYGFGAIAVQDPKAIVRPGV